MTVWILRVVGKRCGWLGHEMLDPLPDADHGLIANHAKFESRPHQHIRVADDVDGVAVDITHVDVGYQSGAVDRMPRS